MTPQLDPWTVLGVSRAATPEEVKEQWRRLCKQHHPDLQPEHLRGPAEKYFKEISAAYRTITSRSSNLAAYADFTAAAAQAGGGPFAAGYRTAWSSGGAGSKFSNGVVAGVLVIPLVLTGMWMALKLDEGASHWRPHGFLGPPDNPYLREDMRPKVHSHLRSYLLRKQREEEEAAAAAAARAASEQSSTEDATAGQAARPRRWWQWGGG